MRPPSISTTNGTSPEVNGNTREDFKQALDLAAKVEETRDTESDKYLRFRMREKNNGNGMFLPKLLITVTGGAGDYRLNVTSGEGAFITAERGFVEQNGDLSVKLHVNELKWDEPVPARRYRISAGSTYQSGWLSWSPTTGQRDFTVPIPALTGVTYLTPVSVTYELLGNSNLTDGDLPAIAVELPNADPVEASLEDGALQIRTGDSNDNVVVSNAGSNIRVTVNGVVSAEHPSQDVDYVVSELRSGSDSVSNLTSQELYVVAGDGDFSLNAGNASLISNVLLDDLYVNAGRLRVLVDQDLRSLSVNAGALLELGRIDETGGSRAVRIHGANSNLISSSEALYLWALASSGFYLDIADGTNHGGGTGINFESGTVSQSTVNGLGFVVVDDILGQSYEFREAILGDLDGDGDVSFDDFLVLDDNYNAIDAIWDQGDLNGDGVVDFDDFLLQSGNYGDFYEAAN